MTTIIICFVLIVAFFVIGTIVQILSNKDKAQSDFFQHRLR